MNTKTTMSGLSVAAAAAAMFLAAPMAMAGESGFAAGHCMGANACKGQSACKTAANACNGQNACKGQGFTEASKTDCATAGGKSEAPKQRSEERRVGKERVSQCRSRWAPSN